LLLFLSTLFLAFISISSYNFETVFGQLLVFLSALATSSHYSGEQPGHTAISS